MASNTHQALIDIKVRLSTQAGKLDTSSLKSFAAEVKSEITRLEDTFKSAKVSFPDATKNFEALKAGLKALETALSSSAKAGEAQLKQLQTAVSEGIVRINEDVKRLNISFIPPQAAAETKNVVAQVQQSLTQLGALAQKNLQFKPINISDLSGESKEVQTAFSLLQNIISGLTTHAEQFKVALGNSFRGQGPVLQNFRASLEAISPVFNQLAGNSAQFGVLFKSGTVEAKNNIYLLETALLGLQHGLSKNTRFDLSGVIEPIRQLRTQIETIETAKSSIKPIEKEFNQLQLTAHNVNTSLERVHTVISSVGSGQKLDPLLSGYQEADRATTKLLASIALLENKLKALNTSFTVGGSNLLPADLQINFDRFNVTLQQLKANASAAKTELNSIKGTNIDLGVSKVTKDLNVSTDAFSKNFTSLIQKLAVSFNQLSTKDNFFTKVQTELRTLLNEAGKPERVTSLFTNLQAIVSQFITTLQSANSVNLNLPGVKEAKSQLDSIIPLVDSYIIQLNNAAKLKLSQDPNNVALQNEVVLYDNLTKALAISNESLSKNYQQFSAGTQIIELFGRSVSLSNAYFAEFTALQSKLGSNASLTELTHGLDNVTKISKSARDEIGRIVEKMLQLKMAGATLPNELKGMQSSGSIYAPNIQSLDELILFVNKGKTELASLQKQLVNTFTPVSAISNSLQQLSALTSKAFTFPSSSVEYVNSLRSGLTDLILNFKNVSSTVTNFSNLQNAYNGHKQNLSGLQQTITEVIGSLRLMNQSTITIGNTTVQKNALIASLEALSSDVTRELTTIRVALQHGGSSIDDFLKTSASGSRFDLVRTRFQQLQQDVTKAVSGINTITASPTPVSADQVSVIKQTISNLVKEREALLREIQSGITRLDQAMLVAGKTVGSPQALAPLQASVGAAIAEFVTLEKAIKGIQVQGSALGKSFGSFTQNTGPVLAFSSALSKVEETYQRVSHGSNFYDQATNKLITDLEKVRSILGLQKTAFESMPRPVLQSYMSDLKTRSSDLSKSLLDMQRVLIALESTNTSNLINPQAYTIATERVNQLRQMIIATKEAMSTMSEVMARQPKGDNIVGSISDVKDAGALLSKTMTGLFNLMGKTGQFNTSAAGFAQTKDNIQRVIGSFRQLEEEVVNNLRTMGMWAMGFQMLGQSMIQPFKEAVQHFVAFTNTMAFIKGATGETQASLDNLASTAKEMGTLTLFSAEKSAEGLKQLALAGYTVAQQIQALPVILNLATATELGLAEATEIVVNVMASQRIGMEGIGRATDIMSMAAIKTTASLSDMGIAFRYIGSLAGTMQNDLEDTAAATALLHNAGMKGCYDDKTEVMTRTGFKTFKELGYLDEIMTLNPTTKQLEWQKPTQLFEYDVEENLHYFKNSWLDLAVTKEHKLFIDSIAGHSKFIEAKDFKQGHFFRTGIWEGQHPTAFTVPLFNKTKCFYQPTIEQSTVEIKTWVEFLGWYFAKGSTEFDAHGNPQIVIEKDDPQLASCLQKLPFTFKKLNNSWVSKNIQLFSFLQNYGTVKTRRLPIELKEYSVELLQSFLRIYLRAFSEKCNYAIVYNKDLSFDLQEVIIKSGYGATVAIDRDSYKISVAYTQTKPFFSKAEVTRSAIKNESSKKSGIVEKLYKGKVFCVEVPNHVFYVRRNGKGVFCGNSLAGTALRGALQALLNPTRDEAKVLKGLSDRLGGVGLEITNAQGKFVGFVRLIQQFEKAGMTTAEVLELFGQRAGPGMAALLQMGSEKLKSLETDLRNAEGSTTRLAINMEKTLGGSITLMSNNFIALSESIGQSLEPTLKFITGIITSVTQKIMIFREAFPLLTSVIDNLVGGLAALAVAVGGLAIAFAMVIVPVVQASKFFGIFTIWILRCAAALETFVLGSSAAAAQSALLAATTAQGTKTAFTALSVWKGLGLLLKTLFLFFTRSPIGIFITVVTALTVAFFSFYKSATVVNRELQRQADIVSNTRDEITALTSKIRNLGKEADSLKTINFSLNMEDVFNTKSFEEKKNAFGIYLIELRDRFNEAGESFKKSMLMGESFDPVTGKLNGLKFISKETGDVIASFNEDMLKQSGTAKILTDNVDQLNKALNTVSQQALIDIVSKQSVNNVKQMKTELASLAKIKRESANSTNPFESAYNQTFRATRITEYYNKVKLLQEEYIKSKENAQKAVAVNDTQALNAEKTKQGQILLQLKSFINKYHEIATRDQRSVYLNQGNLGEALKKELEGAFTEIQDFSKEKGELTAKLAKTVSDAIVDLQHTGQDVNKQNVQAWLTKTFLGSGLREADVNTLIQQVGNIYDEMDRAAKTGASKVSFSEGLVNGFRQLQRMLDSTIRLTDEQAKQLKQKMDEIKTSLDIYKAHADNFNSIRDSLLQSGKAELDVGLGNLEQQANQFNEQLLAVGSTSSQVFGFMRMGVTQNAEELKVLQNLSTNDYIKSKKKEVSFAQQTEQEKYSLLKNSITKQIDDLERYNTVVENVTTQPVNIQYLSGLNFSDTPLKRYFETYQTYSQQLVKYTVLFNQQLLRAQTSAETQKLANTVNFINTGLEKTKQFYDAMIPLTAIGSKERIKVEQDYFSKKKEFEAKGVEASKEALNRIYEQHKAISDKIKGLEEERAQIINQGYQLRKKWGEADLNEEQKLEQQKANIVNLQQQASLAQQQGNLDKARELYKMAFSELESLQINPFDSDTRQFAEQYLQLIQKGSLDVNSALTESGKSQQQVLEEAARKMEATMRSFQKAMMESSVKLQELATALNRLMADEGKMKGVDVDNKSALEKIVQLSNAYDQLAIQFSKPLPLRLEGSAAVSDLTNLLGQQKNLNQSIADTSRMSLQLTDLQKNVDKTNDWYAASEKVKEVMSQVGVIHSSIANIKPGTLLDAKEGSEELKQAQDIQKAIEDRIKAISDLILSYKQIGQVVPAAYQEEINKLTAAKDAFKVNADNKILVSDKTISALSRADELLSTMTVEYQNLSKISTEKMTADISTNAVAMQQFVQQMQEASKSQLIDPSIRLSQAGNVTALTGELKNYLDNLAKLPELQSRVNEIQNMDFSAPYKMMDQAIQGSIGSLKQQGDTISSSGAQAISELEKLQQKLTDVYNDKGLTNTDRLTKIQEIGTAYQNLNQKLQEVNQTSAAPLPETTQTKEKLDQTTQSAAQLNETIKTTPPLVVNADASKLDPVIEKVHQLLTVDGKTITITLNAKSNGSFNAGGLIPLPRFNIGGLIQKFANGGKTLFKRITHKVPGIGNTDTVPAMLTPGEYVIKKSSVEKYGTDFLSALNQGLIQFKALGGSVLNIPDQISGLNTYTVPKLSFDAVPEKSTEPGVEVTINIGNKSHVVQTPRNQVRGLVDSLLTLDRGY